FLDDGLTGFVGSLNSSFFMTDDGGQTWTDIADQLPGEDKDICGLAHQGDSIWGVGVFADPAYLIQSNDRGQTWSWTSMEDHANALVELAMSPSGELFAGGRTDTGATILRSTDGGQVWETVFANSDGLEFIWKIDFVTEDVVYGTVESFSGSTSMVKSVDGGNTWVELPVSPFYYDLQGIGFIDEETGWVCPRNAALWLTTDGGQSWTQDETFFNVNRITFFPGNRNRALAAASSIAYYQPESTSNSNNSLELVLPTFGPVFPNPVAGPAEVALDLIRNTRVSIDLLDLSGRQLKEIYRGRISAGEHSIALGDLSGYPPGSYLLALRTSEGHQSISLIIQ
ncbi:MAG: YCF48-related protein, partial [Bacteroidota bacterium]